jgi:predicted ATPase
MGALEVVEVEGYRAIRKQRLEVKPLNLLLGANKVGKSSFTGALELIRTFVADPPRFDDHVRGRGGVQQLLHRGPPVARRIAIRIRLDTREHEAIFEVAGSHAGLRGPSDAQLIADQFLFHDASAFNRIWGPCRDEPGALRADGSNLAAWLHRLRGSARGHYDDITEEIRAIDPTFRDFVIEPHPARDGHLRLRCERGAPGNDISRKLSSPASRFLCLAALLLQPDQRCAVIISDPEYGLSSEMISRLASLLGRAAARERPLIVATQSHALRKACGEPSIKANIVGVARANGETILCPLSAAAFTATSVDSQGLSSMRQARVVQAPVGWLLGPDLASKLGMILRRRSDPRNWMPSYHGYLHDERANGAGKLVKPKLPPRQPSREPRPAAPEVPAVDVAAPAEPAEQRPPEPLEPLAEAPAQSAPDLRSAPDLEDVWFDYVSDIGDGVDAMYAVAYASLVSFDRERAPGQPPAAGETWSPGSVPEALRVAPGGAEATLPRGQFLFVGGDTAYHVADAPTLTARVEAPFGWAFDDAFWNEHLPPDARKARSTRRIYGIPGNHDWYDNLRGFSMVFRRGPQGTRDADWSTESIDLPELQRVQLASYAAILLPHGWQLWGVDIDSPMDDRQRAYFLSLQRPERLILATPSPAIAFHGPIAKPHHREVCESLQVELPSLPVEPNTRVSPRARLDLSGDIHHYARYYPAGEVGHYGSVVSGLGGAFHHPSFTRASGAGPKIEPVTEYPSPRESREQVGAELLKLFSTQRGSWASFLLIVLTLIVGFDVMRSGGGAWLISLLPGVPLEAERTDGRALARAGWALGSLLLSILGMAGAVAWGRRVSRKQVEHPELVGSLVDAVRQAWRSGSLLWIVSPYRSYWLSWVIAVVAAAPFVFYSAWGPGSPHLALDVAMLVVLGLPLLGACVGWFYAAEYLTRLGKAAAAAAGAIHGAALVYTAIACAPLVGTGWAALGWGLIAYAWAAGMLYVGRLLFRREQLWGGVGLAVLALVVLGVAMVILLRFAGGSFDALPTTKWQQAACLTGSGLLAMLFGSTWFAWYLAVTGWFHAHNNELGGAARVDRYRQIIRFHVHAGGLTGYVIAVENIEDKDGGRPRPKAAHLGTDHLVFRLIDVFTIRPPSPRAVGGADAPAGGPPAGGPPAAAA